LGHFGEPREARLKAFHGAKSDAASGEDFYQRAIAELTR
jgi:hypothetical protein